MLTFEWTLVLLAASVALAAIARRLKLPYPALLAAMGTAVAFLPGGPDIVLDPQLALAVFVAPILLDTAYDTSNRDLRRNWIPIAGLVFFAVGVTTVAVAAVVRWLVPDLPWAAAIALGAIVAPPDAAAASAVLRETRPPHRLLQILEGESLLNDASALLIYRFAVGAAMGDVLTTAGALPVLAGTLVGSVAFGLAAAWVAPKIIHRIDDAAMSTVTQFVCMFGVWIAAERLHLSGILAVVTFAFAISRVSAGVLPARIRLPSLAMWATVVFVLNVLAFVLMGLQIGPIVDRLDTARRLDYAKVAAAVLGVVIVVRLCWVMTATTIGHWRARRDNADERFGPRARGGLVVGWCGMRGIVTLAAALALPAGEHGLPSRDLMLVTAFVVVLGTLLIQGLTLRPLLLALDVHDDDPVERETTLARERVLGAVLETLEGDESKAADALRFEFHQLWPDAGGHAERFPKTSNDLPKMRHEALQSARDTLTKLLEDETIGDDAYRRIEDELDRAELYAEVAGDEAPSRRER